MHMHHMVNSTNETDPSFIDIVVSLYSVDLHFPPLAVVAGTAQGATGSCKMLFYHHLKKLPLVVFGF